MLQFRVCRLGLVLLFAIAGGARGAWTLVSAEEIASTPACRRIQTLVAENEKSDRAQLHLALCDLNKASLRIIDQPQEPRINLAGVMEKENCLAGVNGGYFDSDYAPLGLLISNRRVVAPLRKARLLSGVLSVTNGRVRIQRVSEFSMKSKVTAAVQSGPFLIDHGRAVPHLDDSRAARRTFVATGTGNQIALAFCSEVSLAQLSRILVVPRVMGKFTIERALNLDGGSSSAFWIASGESPFSISEQKTVRDFVALVPR